MLNRRRIALHVVEENLGLVHKHYVCILEKCKGHVLLLKRSQARTF